MDDGPPYLPPSLSTAPLVSVAVNAALASIKILAGFFGNSYALIAAARCTFQPAFTILRERCAKRR